MSYPVSVCIIAKNEEKYIEACLEHLKPYHMEIIVVDTGSTDRTKEIALKYTDKVFDFVWIDDFSAARNFCAQKASNDWIFVIDCDEYLEKLDMDLLSVYMAKNMKKAGKIKIQNIARRNNGETTYVNEEITRFYHRGFFRFAYPVHENVVPIKEMAIQEASISVPIEVIHHGYNIDEKAMKTKQERNLKLLYRALENARFVYTYALSLLGIKEFLKALIQFVLVSTLPDRESLGEDLGYCYQCIIKLYTMFGEKQMANDFQKRYDEYHAEKRNL